MFCLEVWFAYLHGVSLLMQKLGLTQIMWIRWLGPIQLLTFPQVIHIRRLPFRGGWISGHLKPIRWVMDGVINMMHTKYADLSRPISPVRGSVIMRRFRLCRWWVNSSSIRINAHRGFRTRLRQHDRIIIVCIWLTMMWPPKIATTL